MLDLLITNGLVVTQNQKREIKQVNIGIKDGIIIYLGNEMIPSNQLINAEEYVILPAFLNAHIHFGEYFLRGCKENLSTDEYILLGEKFHNKYKKINDEIRSSSINNVVLESIQNGTLTVFGVRGWPNVFEFPVNAFLGYPMMNSKKLKDYKIDFEEKFNSLPRKANVEYFVGLHSVKWMDEKTLIEISNFVNKNQGTKLSSHVCETIEEVDYIKKKYGMTPVDLLDKYKLLNENTLLVHCNYLTDNDVKLLKDNKVSVAACHNSNLRLKNKPCNVKKLLDNKINVMIATDGPATNDSLSLLDSLRTTGLLTNLNSSELLDMITINPARYMKTNSGSIDKGNKADILFYNRNSLNLTYSKSIIENLIYTSGNKPKIIIKDGKVIIKNYCFENEIECDIIREKNRIIKLLENNNFF